MMKLLELFSGYGTASFALKQIGIDFEVVGYSDIDKYANQCFQQNHGGKELGDATKIDPNNLKDFDLLTGGFPCQAFSVAGKMLGELDIRGTLFNEIIRIAEVKKPKYMLLENVKGLLSKRHRPTFNKIISELYRIGYFVKWKIVNTKEHGIPQNRERVFLTCFKSWSDFCNFEWPEKENLKIFIKDILEEDVSEKYFLSDKKTNELLYRSKANIPEAEDPFIAASRGRYKENGETEQRFESRADGCTNTITSVQKDNYICIKNATKRGFLEGFSGDGIALEHPNSTTRRGRVQEQISPTLQCNDTKGVITENLKIRKLTPKECFRLQGFLKDEVGLADISETQQYKLAGNGQSVNVVKKIFERMLR